MTLDITTNERTMLLALALHPDREHTPAQLIEDMPVAFGSRSVQGIHQTGASLARKNLAWRCDVGGDRVGYQIRPEVLPELGVTPEPFTRGELDALVITAGELWASTERFDPDEILNDYQRGLLDRAAAEFRQQIGDTG
jgi:hypothetical protein